MTSQAHEQTYYDQVVEERGYDPLAHMRVSREEFLSVFLTEHKQPEWLQEVLRGNPVAVSEPIEWEGDDDADEPGVEVTINEEVERYQKCEYPECDFEGVGDDEMLEHMDSEHPVEEDEEDERT